MACRRYKPQSPLAQVEPLSTASAMSLSRHFSSFQALIQSVASMAKIAISPLFRLQLQVLLGFLTLAVGAHAIYLSFQLATLSASRTATSVQIFNLPPPYRPPTQAQQF